MVGKGLAVVSSLVANALVARLLTSDEMGAYFLIFSLASVCAVVAQLGLGQTVVRLVAESLANDQPGRASDAVRWALRFGTLGVLVVAGALVLGVGTWVTESVFDSTLLTGAVGLMALWVGVLTFRNLLAETFRGFKDIRLATIFQEVMTGILSALLFAALWLLRGRGDLNEVIMLSVGAGFTTALIAGLLLREKLRPLGTSGEKLKGQEVLKIAQPVWVVNISLIALTQVDLWIIGLFRSESEVAIYGAAMRLVALVAMPLLIVNAVVPPFIAEMYTRGNRKHLEVALRTAATTASIPASLALGLVILLGGPILGFVYGDFYRGGATVLILLSLGQLVNVWAGPCGLVLIMTGHQTLMMAITIGCGLITVVGSLLLVKHYGAIGVAGVAAVTMMLQNVLSLTFSKLKAGIWTHIRLPSGLPASVEKG